jgi:hypothetical protein
MLVEDIDVAHGGFHERFRRRLAVLALQILADGAGIDPDTDRDALVAGAGHYLADLVVAADVARIDAQAVDAVLGDAQGDLVVEVDIGDQRHVGALANGAERLRRIHARHGYAHDVRSGVLERLDLRHGGVDIAGLRVWSCSAR